MESRNFLNCLLKQRFFVFQSLLILGLGLFSGFADPPDDLAWLKSKVGDGALGYENSGKIYLVELSNNASKQVGSGHSPEFSPNGYYLAWIDGSSVRCILRNSSSDVHTLATGVSSASGVHWVGNSAFVAVKSGKWKRIGLDGSEKDEAELTKLGTGSTEVDVKLGSDGVWSYVNGMTWKTSDGKSGAINGHCSGSLSPDGKSATGLENGHVKCNFTQVRSGGKSGSVAWNYGSCGSKGFDNQRWSSNQSDLLVVQYECKNWIAVLDITNGKATKMGGTVSGEAYGDFVKGSPGGSWGTVVVKDSLTLDAENLDFSADLGGSNPADQVLKVSGGNIAPKNVTVSGAGDWLSVTVGAATGTNGAIVPLTHKVSIAGLKEGSYTKELTVSTSNLDKAKYRVNLVISDNSSVFKITSPNGKETFHIGDKMEITWMAKSGKTSGADLYLYVGGSDFLPLSTSTIFPEDADWGKWSWTIPATLGGKSVTSSTARIQIVDYNQNDINDLSDADFSIIAKGSSIQLASEPNFITLNAENGRLTNFTNLNGRKLGNKNPAFIPLFTR